MKKLFVILILSVLLLSSCTVSDGVETSGTPDTTAPEITTDEVTPEETTDASETWYLTKQMEIDPMIPEIPEEYASLVVKAPLVTEGEQNGIRYKVEFFRDDYKMGELIQVRITLTNYHTIVGKKLNYIEGIGYGFFYSAGDGSYSWRNPLPMTEEEKLLHQKGIFSYQVIPEGLDGFSAERYGVLLKTINYGETHVLERVFLADPVFFSEPREFAFYVSPLPSESDIGFTIKIPIEVVLISPHVSR